MNEWSKLSIIQILKYTKTRWKQILMPVVDNQLCCKKTNKRMKIAVLTKERLYYLSYGHQKMLYK